MINQNWPNHRCDGIFLRIFRFTLWITLSFSMKKRTFPILYISQRADVLFGFKTSKIYAAFFNSNRCCPVLPFCIFLCSLLMLWEIARITLWAVTFSVPRYRYLRNSISCFTTEKEPYAWMLRFMRSWVPYLLVIRSKSSARFCFIVFETYNILFRSSIGVLQLFPFMHSFFLLHPLQLLHLYTVVVRRYPVAVFSVRLYCAVSVCSILQV